MHAILQLHMYQIQFDLHYVEVPGQTVTTILQDYYKNVDIFWLRLTKEKANLKTHTYLSKNSFENIKIFGVAGIRATDPLCPSRTLYHWAKEA